MYYLSYVVHHSSGKLKDIKHSSGVITGLTMIDFILIPARARLSIAYTGENEGEGFFSLKRLWKKKIIFKIILI